MRIKIEKTMTIDIKEENGVLTGILNGRLDTAASTKFAEDMKPLMEGANKPIVLECNNLDFISSSGLRLLLSLRKETNAKGGSITIKGLNNEVKNVFVITGYNKLFNLA